MRLLVGTLALATIALISPSAVAEPAAEKSEAAAAASFAARHFAEAGRLYEELFTRSGRPEHLLAAARSFASIPTKEARARAVAIADRCRELPGSDPAAIAEALESPERAAPPKTAAPSPQPPPALSNSASPSRPPQPPRRRSLDEKPYSEGNIVPPGYHLETRIGSPVIAGAAMLGGGYLGASIMGTLAVSSGNSNAATLFIPLAGPAIAFAQIDWNDNGDGGRGPPSTAVIVLVGIPLVGIGLTQTAGVISLIVGASSPRKVVVQDAPAAFDRTPRVRFGGDRIFIEGRF